MKLSKVFFAYFKCSPQEDSRQLGAVDYKGKGTLCNQVTCERTHHKDTVISSNTRTQLSKLVSLGGAWGGREKEAPPKGFSDRSLYPQGNSSPFTRITKEA